MGQKALLLSYDNQTAKYFIGKLDSTHLDGGFPAWIKDKNCHTKRWLF
jgi:hypothetical protein